MFVSSLAFTSQVPQLVSSGWGTWLGIYKESADIFHRRAFVSQSAMTWHTKMVLEKITTKMIGTKFKIFEKPPPPRPLPDSRGFPSPTLTHFPAHHTFGHVADHIWIFANSWHNTGLMQSVLWIGCNGPNMISTRWGRRVVWGGPGWDLQEEPEIKIQI